MPFDCKRFEEQRERSGLTLGEIASSVGVEISTIQRYEKGIINNLYVLKVEQLASVLDCDPAYLVGWQDVPKLSQSCSTTDYENLDRADKTVVDTVISGMLTNSKYSAIKQRRA